MDVRYERYKPGDLAGVLELCLAEGWPTLPDDPERAARALTGPGVHTIVARDVDAVVGFASLLSDGAVQAYLSLLVVSPDRRGEGLGAGLLRAALASSGATRVDLLSEPAATGFYERLPHRRLTGFRLHLDAAPPPGSA